jgi:hypothetical protein
VGVKAELPTKHIAQRLGVVVKKGNSGITMIGAMLSVESNCCGYQTPAAGVRLSVPHFAHQLTHAGR